MNKEPLLEIQQMSKSFGPTKALQNVDMRIYRGQVRGLIGENGSGKSTISSIIAGMQPADSGKMLFKGEPYTPASMLDAAGQGIAMIVQEAGTIANITVAENIFLGKESRFGRCGFINKKRMEQAAQEVLDKVGITGVDPAGSINRLNFEERKLIEIARAMIETPEILIVDETTTALSLKGRELLYGLMKRLRDEDRSVLFISHDLDELMETCDVLTVLRDGILIDNLEREDMEHERIKELMVGRKIEGDYYRSDFDGSFGEKVVLRVEQVTVGRELENFDLELHEGEILGIGGLSGSGMHELGRVAFGVEKPITGQVVVEGSGDRIDDSHTAVRNSMGYVSKNRDLEALILQASIRDNILLPSYHQVKQGGLISKRKLRQFAQEQVDHMAVKCASIHQEVQFLSGGNKQKVVFAKWFGTNADILILDCPTRGIDVGVKADMYRLITELKHQGKGIIMISEELLELMGMSDRMMIFKDGKLAKEFQRSASLTEKDIIEYII